MNRFMIKDDEGTLKELAVGILFYCIVVELLGVFFVKNPFAYSLGIAVGGLSALYYMYHMLWALENSLEYGEAYATKNIRKHGIIRYLVLVVLMLVIIYTNVINPLSWFLALMGVKAAAYLQPLTHKLLLGKEGRIQEKNAEKEALLAYEKRVELEGYPDDEDEEDEEFFFKEK